MQQLEDTRMPHANDHELDLGQNPSVPYSQHTKKPCFEINKTLGWPSHPQQGTIGFDLQLINHENKHKKRYTSSRSELLNTQTLDALLANYEK